MAKQTINIGTNQDDGTGDLLRVAFNKVNENFTEIYNELGGASLSSLNFNSNVISTDTTNQDIVLSPSGAGEVHWLVCFFSNRVPAHGDLPVPSGALRA